MNLRDIPQVESWLTQFEVPDLYVVEHMLRRLRYVSFEELEAWLHESVKGVLEEIEKSDGRVAVAIFPVAKPFINKFNKDKEEKLPNDSAGRIAHSLKNIERDLPRFVELSPRDKSMRQKKVKHIIFVDDFVGTGNRFSDSWKTMVSPSVKSWCSRGWCKIWLITFAAHKSGLNRVVRKIRPLTLNQVRINLEIDKSFFLENESMKAVLQKYGTPLGRATQAMGYGGLASPVIFQYGCPNNVPLMFWLRPSRASRISWRPLFPNRSVSNDVYPLFGQDFARDALPEELWMAGHYRLALNALEQLSNYNENHQLMLVLGLLAKGHGIAKIRNVMVLGGTEFDNILRELKEGGLVSQDDVVTRFGKDVLARAAKPCIMDILTEKEANFFPSSFLGFQREA
ncbi:hypothetical protein [Zoogloea sp.]|uniref:phosphoribosyltransferase-like protein n=1 Tax=Zoogloea sp. TaxID=49181 RepID=UPI001DA543C9|nr:hypothetical protein [Zoogloea sp.]MBK6655576.1 hypothetical protein [Zoogloea sp.]